MSEDDPTDGRETWFEVNTTRVQRLTHSRRVQARDEADAIAIIAEGTAWPSSYDDRDGEILERGEPVVTRIGACRFEDHHGDRQTCAICERAARLDEAKAEEAAFMAACLAQNTVSPAAIPCRLCLAKPGMPCVFAPGPPLVGDPEFHPFRVSDAAATTSMVLP